MFVVTCLRAGGDKTASKAGSGSHKPAESDQEESGEENRETEEEAEEEEEEGDEMEEEDEKPAAPRGAGRTAPVRAGSFVLPQVKEEDLAKENEDVSLTVLGQDGADEETAFAQARTQSSVYYESGSNKAFRRKSSGKHDKSTLQRDPRTEKDERFLKSFLDAVANLIASSFIFCQGLLGGLSLMMLYFSANQTDNEMLRCDEAAAACSRPRRFSLCLHPKISQQAPFTLPCTRKDLPSRAKLKGAWNRSYSPVADDTQKAFLFLSSFAMIGALDKYSKDHMMAWLPRGGMPRRDCERVPHVHALEKETICMCVAYHTAQC